MAKEGSSDYKKVRKGPLTELFYVEPKRLFYLWHRCVEPLKQLYFKE